MLWEVLVRVLEVPDWFLPPPSLILRELFLSIDIILGHLLTTSIEVLLGLALSVIVAINFSLLIFFFKSIEKSVYPLLIATQTIPVITISPLLLVWFGPNIFSKIIIVAIISFFPIIVNFLDGLKSADSEMIMMAKQFGASKIQIFYKIQLPYSFPYLISGLKIASVASVIGAVVGEWVGASGGLGWLIKTSSPQFLTERVFASIFVLSLLAVSLFSIFYLIERLVLKKFPIKGRG
jgi:ABC-type nitrate/sulfonate/bicarbonate transport system permease component|tara:strand:- start:708 stop:1415 length:708 start_codon:yes stop_codon:yes gene_type:complete